jgi:hypothetical protein
MSSYVNIMKQNNYIYTHIPFAQYLTIVNTLIRLHLNLYLIDKISEYFPADEANLKINILFL